MLNEGELHCTLDRKHRVSGTVWMGRRQRPQERKSIHLLATALGEPRSEKRGSSMPCLLLVQGNHIFHNYCKQAELGITASLLRVNQLTEPSHSLTLTAFTSRCPGARASHCTQTVAEMMVLVQLGIAHFCLSTSSWLSPGVYKNCKPGNRTLYFSFTTIWYCESMTHSQGS